ncbi:Teichuronic acid biosynthesis protein TuaB [Pontiella sulfatireligans]|uniref:Teichuronic acid biosynthesis protein TuaB n=2 Tax=Pontiella sulfatireligans TaxID=2750658 RepID=A0A6C2ULP1_9BACT|nr:Teichuronic acid biosynthesis protein TuaB [Pontiella sulfatireligans]
MPSLGKQALHGAFWSFAERFGQQGIQFVIGIVLARLLEPKDFGVLGMIMIFFALAESVVDSGFGQALIQKQDASRTDESTIFWFNLLLGLFMAGALFLAAPWISSFYGLPLLKLVTQAYALNLLINSFGIVQNALLIKDLAFKRRMVAVLASMLISGLVGIFLAIQGFGVWALVVQSLVMNATRTVGLWMVHSWRPLFVFSTTSLRRLWKFGSHLLFAGLSNTIFDNIYLVIIGRVYSASDLGFYQRSKQLVMLTSYSLSQVISQVNFPLISRIQNDPIRMRYISEKIFRSTMLLILPIMTGLALIAPSLIQVVFGEKWMPCISYFQALCVVGILYPLNLLNLDILKALGRSDLIFRLEFFKKGLVLLNITIAWRYGIMALLLGQVCCSFLALIPNSFYNRRFIKFGILAQLSSIKGIVTSVAIAGVIAFLFGGLLEGNLTKLLLQSVVYAILCSGILWMLKEPTFVELTKMCWTQVSGGKE